jgi:hypothetical protein
VSNCPYDTNRTFAQPLLHIKAVSILTDALTGLLSLLQPLPLTTLLLLPQSVTTLVVLSRLSCQRHMSAAATVLRFLLSFLVFFY